MLKSRKQFIEEQGRRFESMILFGSKKRVHDLIFCNLRNIGPIIIEEQGSSFF